MNVVGKGRRKAAAARPSARRSVPRTIQRADYEPRASLADQAYETIKRKIITLEFRPGQYLNEVQICKSLGIGRTPVHQALHRLMIEGLVQIIPRKGLIVRPDSLNEVLSLIEARWVIEPYCVGLSVDRVTPKMLEKLAQIMKDAERAARAGDTESFMGCDVAFHSTLAEAAGNQILKDLLLMLHDRATRIWYLQIWQKKDMLVTHREHSDIHRAVVRGDKPAAVAAMQNHLVSLRRRIVQGSD